MPFGGAGHSFYCIYLGTFVRLWRRPAASELPEGMHPQDWWGRKQFYAMNVQLVGDYSKKIRNVVARWSGSTHDARIWRNSQAKVNIESQNMFMIAGNYLIPFPYCPDI